MWRLLRWLLRSTELGSLVTALHSNAGRVATLPVLCGSSASLTHAQVSTRLGNDELDKATKFRNLNDLVSAKLVGPSELGDRAWLVAKGEQGNASHLYFAALTVAWFPNRERSNSPRARRPADSLQTHRSPARLTRRQSSSISERPRRLHRFAPTAIRCRHRPAHAQQLHGSAARPWRTPSSAADHLLSARGDQFGLLL